MSPYLFGTLLHYNYVMNIPLSSLIPMLKMRMLFYLYSLFVGFNKGGKAPEKNTDYFLTDSFMCIQQWFHSLLQDYNNAMHLNVQQQTNNLYQNNNNNNNNNNNKSIYWNGVEKIKTHSTYSFFTHSSCPESGSLQLAWSLLGLVLLRPLCCYWL